MWKGITVATSVAANYVAPSYMKDPDSDILTSPEDTLLVDYKAHQQCLGLYPEELAPNSSIASWAELSQAIIDGDLDKADEAKKKIEDNQRQRVKKAQQDNQPFNPHYFHLDTESNIWKLKSEYIDNLGSVFPHNHKK